MLWQSVLSTETATTAAHFTLDNYRTAYASADTVRLFTNSLQFALGSAALAFSFGTLLAWINERTDTPLKSLFFALALVPLIIPGILFTVSWIFLGSPKIGIVNLVLQHVFGTNAVFINIYSIPGMIWVDGLHYSPMAFLLMTAAFRAMDPALEESAMMSGATLPQIVWRVTIRLASPATAAALLILFVRALESFEVPALLGLPVGIEVYTSAIYDAIHSYPSEIGLASAYGLTLLIITSLCVFLNLRIVAGGHRYATVGGKGFRPRVMRLGRWRYATAAAFRRDVRHVRRRDAVPRPAVVVAAALLQRAVTRRAQEPDLGFLSRRTGLSDDRHRDLEQHLALAEQRDADHAGDVVAVLDRGAHETAGALADR